MKISYRRLLPEDIPVLVQMRQSQLIEEGFQNPPDIFEALQEYYKAHLADGSFVSWVAVANGEIVATSGLSFLAYVPAFNNPSGLAGMVSSMYTVKAYRRLGIAKTLLGLVVDEARERSCGFVSVSASEMGKYLYRSFGFVENKSDMRFLL